MRIAICDDDERELAHLLGLIKEYRLSRRKDIDCRSFQNSTDFLCGLKGGEYDLILLGAPMSGAGGGGAGGAGIKGTGQKCRDYFRVFITGICRGELQCRGVLLSVKAGRRGFPVPAVGQYGEQIIPEKRAGISSEEQEGCYQSIFYKA